MKIQKVFVVAGLACGLAVAGASAIGHAAEPGDAPYVLSDEIVAATAGVEVTITEDPSAPGDSLPDFLVTLADENGHEL